MGKLATAALFPVVAMSIVSAMPAFGQCDLSGLPETTLRSPLIYGATSTGPLDVAPSGQPPPVGDGPLPAPVNPGMLGNPTYIPSVTATPANDIQNPSVQVYWNPANESAPGEAGPSIYSPPPPSTPGDDPGIIHAPLDFVPPPAQVVNINPDGGIPGEAGTERWGGQQSHDWGLYKYRGTRKYDYAQEEQGNTSEDGYNHARSGASTNQDLYGSRYPLRSTKYGKNGGSDSSNGLIGYNDQYQLQSSGDPLVKEQYNADGPPTRPQGVQVTNGQATNDSSGTGGTVPIQTIAPY